MKETFRVTNFKPDTLERIVQANAIIDALPPRELNRLVKQAINRNTNRALMDVVIAKEDVERERIRAAIERSRR